MKQAAWSRIKRHAFPIWNASNGFIGFLASLATVVTTIFALNINEKVGSIDQQISKVDFKISFPTDNLAVSQKELVKGSAPSGYNYVYIFVENGGKYFQEEVRVNNSKWFGWAYFGNETTKAESAFKIYAIATKDSQPSPNGFDFPKDAIYSEPIFVKRKE